MKSAKLGKRTSEVEVTNVSEHGFWLLLRGQERFLAFEHFPWFQSAFLLSAKRRPNQSFKPMVSPSAPLPSVRCAHVGAA